MASTPIAITLYYSTHFLEVQSGIQGYSLQEKVAYDCVSLGLPEPARSTIFDHPGGIVDVQLKCSPAMCERVQILLDGWRDQGPLGGLYRGDPWFLPGLCEAGIFRIRRSSIRPPTVPAVHRRMEAQGIKRSPEFEDNPPAPKRICMPNNAGATPSVFQPISQPTPSRQPYHNPSPQAPPRLTEAQMSGIWAEARAVVDNINGTPAIATKCPKDLHFSKRGKENEIQPRGTTGNTAPERAADSQIAPHTPSQLAGATVNNMVSTVSEIVVRDPNVQGRPVGSAPPRRASGISSDTSVPDPRPRRLPPNRNFTGHELSQSVAKGAADSPLSPTMTVPLRKPAPSRESDLKPGEACRQPLNNMLPPGSNKTPGASGGTNVTSSPRTVTRKAQNASALATTIHTSMDANSGSSNISQSSGSPISCSSAPRPTSPRPCAARTAVATTVPTTPSQPVRTSAVKSSKDTVVAKPEGMVSAATKVTSAASGDSNSIHHTSDHVATPHTQSTSLSSPAAMVIPPSSHSSLYPRHSIPGPNSSPAPQSPAYRVPNAVPPSSSQSQTARANSAPRSQKATRHNGTLPIVVGEVHERTRDMYVSGSQPCPEQSSPLSAAPGLEPLAVRPLCPLFVPAPNSPLFTSEFRTRNNVSPAHANASEECDIHSTMPVGSPPAPPARLASHASSQSLSHRPPVLDSLVASAEPKHPGGKISSPVEPGSSDFSETRPTSKSMPGSEKGTKRARPSDDPSAASGRPAPENSAPEKRRKVGPTGLSPRRISQQDAVPGQGVVSLEAKAVPPSDDNADTPGTARQLSMLAEAAAQLSKIHKENERLSSVDATFHETVRDLEMRLQRAEARCKAADMQRLDLKTELATARTEFEDHLSAANEDHKRILTEEREVWMRLETEYKRQAQKNEEELLQARELLASHTEAVNTLEKKLAAERSSGTRLRRDLDALRLARDDLEAKHRSLQTIHTLRVQDHAATLEREQSRSKALQHDLDVERSMREQAERIVQDVRAECKAPFVVPALLDMFISMHGGNP